MAAKRTRVAVEELLDTLASLFVQGITHSIQREVKALPPAKKPRRAKRKPEPLTIDVEFEDLPPPKKEEEVSGKD